MLFAQQTVQDFFENSNWQGLKLFETNTIDPDIVDQDFYYQEESLQPDLNQTVEKYFSLHNWQGLTIIKNQKQNQNSSTISDSNLSNNYGQGYSLTISVEEFFQRMVWQQVQKPSKPIASQLPPKPKQKPKPAKQEFNLQDLSDLM